MNMQSSTPQAGYTLCDYAVSLKFKLRYAASELKEYYYAPLFPLTPFTHQHMRKYLGNFLTNRHI